MKLEINGVTVEAREEATILEACRENGIRIPTLCHMPGLPPSGACRLCVVEVEGRPNLVASCAFPASEGMKVRTNSPRVRRARRTVLQLLLANHEQECASCIRNGNCELQKLAREAGVRDVPYTGERRRANKDVSSPSIVREPEKCILCGRCVRVCEEIQAVGAIDFTRRGFSTLVLPAFDDGLNVTECVNCGQCVMACPTGALHERTSIAEVWRAIEDPEKVVVFQHAPAISVSIGEEFGIMGRSDLTGLIAAAFRRLGADYVFDTSFSADLTIMEETHELVERIKAGGPFPLFTSCSPGWVKFVEHKFPEFLPNVSSCKSPQQMMGALVKTFFAERLGVEPSRIYSVSVMPCTAKKFEAARPEFSRGGLYDIDAVLTTREAAQMIREAGLDPATLPSEECDDPFGKRTSAGKIFGATGGVAEAALRTAHWMVTGRPAGKLEVGAVRGLEGVKTFTATIDGLEVKTAVVSGLANAARLLKRIKAGEAFFHFVEVMACPGGCIAGGGQPYSDDPEAVKKRMNALYNIDGHSTLRQSHENPQVQRLYAEFLGEPGGKLSHELLHTTYTPRRATVGA